MSNGFIGRRESVGIGLEATPGTAVAAQGWLPHLALTLDQKTEVAQNESALGRVEDVNDSVVTEQWAEGSLNGKVVNDNFGYLLANMFGSNSAEEHGEETAVFDTTFEVNQSTASIPSMTIWRLNPVVNRKYAYSMLSDLEIEASQQGWVLYTGTLQSKVGVSASASAAYTESEPEFSSKDVAVKLADNVAGLSGASALDFKSIKLKLSRKLERYTPMGSVDPTSFDTNAFSVTGTITARYIDTVNELIALGNTAKAMSLTLSNNAVTIGTSAHPGVTFTLAKMRLEPQTLDNKLDQTLTQTFNFRAELSQADGFMVNAVLTGTQDGYAHA